MKLKIESSGDYKKSIIVFVAMVLLVKLGDCKLKIWKHSTDIFDKNNWLHTGEACGSVVFSKHNDAIFLMDNLNTNEVVFPENGRLILRPNGIVVKFVPKSQSIKLKPLRYARWADPSQWVHNVRDNTAIPHREHLPCIHDDVWLPHTVHSAINMIYFQHIRIESLIFGKQPISNNDLTHLANSYIGHFVFANLYRYSPFEINNVPCDEESGCVCSDNSDEVLFCDNVGEDEQVQLGMCEKPVWPVGFCGPICGAYVLLDVIKLAAVPFKNIPGFSELKSFSIEKTRTMLSDLYSDIDTHVSKVKNDSIEVIQVVFREKEFTGKSLDYAKDFHSRLQSYELVRKIELYTSSYFPRGSAGSLIGMVFGTLFGVLSVFLVLFIYFTYFAIKLPSSTSTYLLARYSRNLSGEGEDVAGLICGSVQSLDKSFDNPMYGQEVQPEPSGLVHLEMKKSTDITQHENPLYEIAGTGMESVIGGEEEDAEE